jgi:predicted ATP-dependent serine protease
LRLKEASKLGFGHAIMPTSTGRRNRNKGLYDGPEMRQIDHLAELLPILGAPPDAGSYQD